MINLTIKDGQEVQKETIPLKKEGTVHQVYILDASGSMNSSGSIKSELSKYESAIQSINDEISELKKLENDVLISIYEFDSVVVGTERITEHYVSTPASNVAKITGRGAGGNTPLYQTIAYVVEKLLRKTSNKDTVIINIFTDGAHNCNWGKYAQPISIKELITDVEKNRNFAFTFIGTQRDTAFANKELGISLGNSISYDGDAMDLKHKMRTASLSKMKSLTAFYKTDDIDLKNLIQNNKND